MIIVHNSYVKIPTIVHSLFDFAMNRFLARGSSDLSLVPVMRYILLSFFPVNCLCLVLFIYLLLLRFGQKQKNKMVHCCVSRCAGRTETIRPSHCNFRIRMTQTTKNTIRKTGWDTETETESIFKEIFFMKIA